MEERICLSCGNKFIPKDKRYGTYCSQKCFHDYRRVLPDIVCTTCGKLFRPDKQEQVDAERHYCSLKCQHEGLSKLLRKRPDQVCPVCGKLFAVTSNRKKYCSSECAHASLKKYATKADQRKAEKQRYKERHREEFEAAANARATERARQKAEREAQRIADAEKKLLAKIHPCANCGKLTSRQKYCSKKCCNNAANNRKESKRRAKIKDALVDSDITLMDVYKNDMGFCYICGRPCSLDDQKMVDGTIICGPNYPSIDHVIPLSKGGKHSWENVRLACRQCNSEKSDHIPHLLTVPVMGG